jgi:hypothetical protein
MSICIALLLSCIGFDDSNRLTSEEKNSFDIVLFACAFLAFSFAVLQSIKKVLEQAKGNLKQESQQQVQGVLRVQSSSLNPGETGVEL